MNLAKIVKLAAAKPQTLDEMGELLSAVGVDAEIKPCTNREDVAALVAAASQPGAQIYKMEARMGDGSRMLALMVLP